MKNNIKKRRNLITAILLLLLALACLTGLFYFIRVSLYQSGVRKLTYLEPDLTLIPDGAYTGEHDADYVGAKVQVVVEDGRITDITILEHKQERGKQAERVISAIVDEQRIDVDAVAGATNSSKVLKKAVENALKQ